MQKPIAWQTYSKELILSESHINDFGHVDNLAYLKIFEDIRWEMQGVRGYTRALMEATGQGPVLLGIDVQYRREAFAQQKVRVLTQTQSYEGKVCCLRQQMCSESGDLLCQADYKIGLLDKMQRKLILPTRAWLLACGAPDAALP